MPLLVRKKLVSADCACTGALARAEMAARAKHAGEMILAKLFIENLPVVFLDRLSSTRHGTHYSARSEAANPAKKKAPRNEPQRLRRHVRAISWSVESPRVPSYRHDGGRRSRLRW